MILKPYFWARKIIVSLGQHKSSQSIKSASFRKSASTPFQEITMAPKKNSPKKGNKGDKKEAKGGGFQQQTFNKWFAQLAQYKAEHGHCNVPRAQAGSNDPLANWVHNTRKRGDNMPIPAHNQLTAMGFEFVRSDKKKIAFDEKYSQLKAFKEQHGTVRILGSHAKDYPDLARWVNYARNTAKKVLKKEKKNKVFNNERLKQLVAIGVISQSMYERGEEDFEDTDSDDEDDDEDAAKDGVEEAKVGGHGLTEAQMQGENVDTATQKETAKGCLASLLAPYLDESSSIELPPPAPVADVATATSTPGHDDETVLADDERTTAEADDLSSNTGGRSAAVKTAATLAVSTTFHPPPKIILATRTGADDTDSSTAAKRMLLPLTNPAFDKLWTPLASDAEKTLASDAEKTASTVIYVGAADDDEDKTDTSNTSSSYRPQQSESDSFSDKKMPAKRLTGKQQKKASKKKKSSNPIDHDDPVYPQCALVLQMQHKKSAVVNPAPLKNPHNLLVDLPMEELHRASNQQLDHDEQQHQSALLLQMEHDQRLQEASSTPVASRRTRIVDNSPTPYSSAVAVGTSHLLLSTDAVSPGERASVALAQQLESQQLESSTLPLSQRPITRQMLKAQKSGVTPVSLPPKAKRQPRKPQFLKGKELYVEPVLSPTKTVGRLQATLPAIKLYDKLSAAINFPAGMSDPVFYDPVWKNLPLVNKQRMDLVLRALPRSAFLTFVYEVFVDGFMSQWGGLRGPFSYLNRHDILNCMAAAHVVTPFITYNFVFQTCKHVLWTTPLEKDRLQCLVEAIQNNNDILPPAYRFLFLLWSSRCENQECRRIDNAAVYDGEEIAWDEKNTKRSAFNSNHFFMATRFGLGLCPQCLYKQVLIIRNIANTSVHNRRDLSGTQLLYQWNPFLSTVVENRYCLATEWIDIWGQQVGGKLNESVLYRCCYVLPRPSNLFSIVKHLTQFHNNCSPYQVRYRIKSIDHCPTTLRLHYQISCIISSTTMSMTSSSRG
jgi:hypothetical protein